MATFHSPSDAFIESKTFIKKMPFDTTTNPVACYNIADRIYQMMWYAAPFSWTLGQLGNVALNGSAQDFALQSATPADFLYVHRVQLTDNANLNQIIIVGQLPINEIQAGNPSQCAFINTSTSSGALRFWPRPVPGEGRTAIAQYKRSPGTISSNNFTNTSAFAFPDVYYSVYQAGILWQAYLWSDDQRAGGALIEGNRVQYTGALGTFMAMLDQMRAAEKLPLEFPGTPQRKG